MLCADGAGISFTNDSKSNQLADHSVAPADSNGFDASGSAAVRFIDGRNLISMLVIRRQRPSPDVGERGKMHDHLTEYDELGAGRRNPGCRQRVKSRGDSVVE